MQLEIERVHVEALLRQFPRLTQLETLRYSLEDDKTVGELFAAKGFLKESAALIRAYDDNTARYLALIAELAEVFPRASGRDIKGLAKLVAKYCHHKTVAPTLFVFKRCAVFRGIEQSVS